MYWANFDCFNRPNIEKIMQRFCHTGGRANFNLAIVGVMMKASDTKKDVLVARIQSLPYFTLLKTRSFYRRIYYYFAI